MWLSEEIASSGKEVSQPRLGCITKVQDDKVTVKADCVYDDIYVISPSGISSIPQVGDEVVVFPMGENAACGTINKRESFVSDGEVYLSTSSGAYVWLKNDGTVVINGQVFSKEAN